MTSGKCQEQQRLLSKSGKFGLMAIACVSLVIGACSSSDGVSPNFSGVANEVEDVTSASEPAISDTDDNTAGSPDSGIGGTSGTGGDTGGDSTEGVGTTGGTSGIVGVAEIPAIQGEWTTECLELGSVFRRQTLSIVGARMFTEQAAYSDQNCTTAVSIGSVLNGATVQRNATTVPTGATRLIPGLGDAIEVNFYFEEATLDNKPLPTTEFPGAEEFRERIEYDIVLVLDDVLYLGDRDLEGYSGTTAQTRPISLDTVEIYNRAP